jgi:hypothetical protein
MTPLPYYPYLKHPILDDDGNTTIRTDVLLFSDVQIIYHDGNKASNRPFPYQRSNLFQLFAKGLCPLTVRSFNITGSYEVDGLMFISVTYTTWYDLPPESEWATYENEKAQYQKTGNWVD